MKKSGGCTINTFNRRRIAFLNRFVSIIFPTAKNRNIRSNLSKDFFFASQYNKNTKGKPKIIIWRKEK